MYRAAIGLHIVLPFGTSAPTTPGLFDGQSDDEELKFLSGLQTEAEDDTDGDGATNRSELLAGTDPARTESQLHSASVATDTDAFVVAERGSRATFELEAPDFQRRDYRISVSM